MNAILSSNPVMCGRNDAPAQWLLDIPWLVLATGEDTNGENSVIEQFMPVGSGPPPHVHPYEDKAFYVVAGEMTSTIGGQTVALGAGTLGHLPWNVAHEFKVAGTEVCHCLNFHTPFSSAPGLAWSTFTPSRACSRTTKLLSYEGVYVCRCRKLNTPWRSCRRMSEAVSTQFRQSTTLRTFKPVVVLLHDRDDAVILVGESRRLRGMFRRACWNPLHGVHRFQAPEPTKGKPSVVALTRELARFLSLC